MSNKGPLVDLETEITLPMTAYGLIDLLDTEWPARCILPGESIEAANRYAGARDMIDILVSLKAEEQGADQDDDP